MTTPTTPAADAVSAIQALIDDEAQYLCVVVAKTNLALLLSEIAAATARESAIIAERDQLRAAIEVCLSFVHADDRSKPSTDPDLCGEIVRVRLSGLCALAEAVTPGIRLAAHQAFVARTLDALSAPAVEGV